MKQSTRWLPLLAVAAGVLLLVPSVLAQPAPGTTLYALLGANRFPGAANTAVGTLRFVSDTQVTLEVKVTGTDVRAWTPRVYSRGNCSEVLNWVGTRGTDGLPLHPVLTNGADAPQALFGADVARIHAALERGERLALMLAGAGSGGATTQSPYRTCTNFGTTPPVTTSTTTSSATATSATTTRTTTTTTTTSTATTSIATTSIATTGIATTTPPAGSPPRVSPLVALVTPEDTPLPITLAATDPDGDAVTFAILAGPGHGSLGPISSPVCPAGVPRTCSAGVRYTPDPDYTGPDQFVYAASDATSGSNPGFVLIRVSPVNDAPVAVNDGYTTAEDSPLVVPAPGVLANDTDVDGDALTAMLVAGPANGTLVLNPDGSFSYTPSANFNGTDSFSYRASDGSLGSNTATVTLVVTPVNDPPVAVFDSYTTAEDTPLTVVAPGVLANDTDVEGSPLTAVLVTGPAHAASFTLNADGSFSYTPATNYNGSDSFTYRANDGALLSNTVTVTITVASVDDPAVQIVKYVNGQDADTATGPHVVVGSTVTFTYVVTNTGDVPLASVAVSDNKLGPITSFTGDINGNGLLDLTETWTYTATATALAGQQTNLGTASGQNVNPPGTTVSDTNPANYFGDAPAIQIVKLTNGTNNDIAPGLQVPIGTPITWTYNVTAGGSVEPIINVVVTDDHGTPGNPADDFHPAPVFSGGFNVGDTNQDGLLGPTETWQYTASGPAGGAVAGQYTNVGRVTGNGIVSNTPVTASNADSYVGVVVDARISITGTATNEVGVDHTFIVTVLANDGLGLGQGDNFDGYKAVAGVTPTVTLVNSNGASFTIISGPTATNANGQSFLVFDSVTAGQVTGNAAVSLSVGGVSLTRDTNPATANVPAGVGGSETPAVKTYVDARISITGTATNAVGVDHTFIVTVLANDGLGLGQGDNFDGYKAVAGVTPTVTLVNSIGASFTIISGPTATDANGQSFLVFDSATAGQVTGNAAVTLTVGGLSLTRDTNPATANVPAGVGGSETPAVKTYVAADLSITKTDGATTAVPGTPKTYTITVTNNGPSAVTGAALSDPLPAGVTAATWAFAGATAGGVVTGPTSGSGALATTVNLPIGATVTFTFTVQVDPSATGSLVNTATVTPPGGTPRGATDVDTLTPQADLSVTKTNATAAVPGTNTTYTITVTNNGPSTVTGATVSDVLPAGTEFVSATNGATYDVGANTVRFTSGTLATGGSTSFQATLAVDALLTGTLSNTATVSPPAGVTDPDPTDNSATDTDTLTAPADLSITKTDGSPSAVAGDTVTYTIIVANAGPNTATGATVTDQFAAALTNVTWTSSAGGGATGNVASGAGDINNTGITLPMGATITYTVTGTVNPLATGSLVNTAMVAAGPGTTDTDPTNNSATDTDQLEVANDFNFSKTDGVSIVLAGGSTTYTITLQTFGPSGFHDVTISDPLPANATSATWSATNGHAGTGAINDVLGDVPPGTTITYTMTVQVNATPAGFVLVNTATFSSDSGVFARTDLDFIVSTPVIQLADLAIAKTDGSDTAVPGTTTTYTITVTNNGPSTVGSLTLTDSAPASLLDPAFGPPSAGSYDPATGIWSGLSLATGQSVTIQLDGTIDPAATGTLTNSATVSTRGGTIDIDPTDNSATDEDTLTPQADVSVTLTDGVTQVTAGTATTYTATITNNGPSAARVNTEHLITLNGGLVANPGRSLGTLAPGVSETNIYTYTVPPDAAGILVDVASATAVFADDPDPSDDAATDVDVIIPSAN